MSWNFFLMFALAWWLVVFSVGFFGEILAQLAKQVIGSVSVYLEESKSEIKLVNWWTLLVCCPFTVSEETENYIGIQTQKA